MATVSITMPYRIGDDDYEGLLIRPGGVAEAQPAVVLVPEWSGLNAGMVGVAERLAGADFTVAAIDLYGRGIRGDERGDNSHLIQPLLDDRAELRRRLLGALDAVRAHPDVDSSRIAALGFCFGGLGALDLARAVPDGLVAVVSVHAMLDPPPVSDERAIVASILMLHGWEDPVAPPPAVVAIAAELTTREADWQLHAYGHALHAFTFEGANMPERGIAYDARSAERAWTTLIGFLRDHLQLEGANLQ